MRFVFCLVFLSFFLFLSSSMVSCQGASNNCDAGSYYSVDQQKCVLCPLGSFQDYPGSTECLKCFRDTFSDVEGAKECQLCPPGYNAPDRGAKECTICPGGHFIDPAGAQQRLSICLPCSAGQWSRPASIACQLCPPGFFSAEGADLCTPCPINTYASSEGSAVCIACPEGYTATGASASCTANINSNNIQIGEGSSNMDSSLSTNKIIIITVASVGGLLVLALTGFFIRRHHLQKDAEKNRLMIESQKRSSLNRSSFSQSAKRSSLDSESITETV